MNQSGLACQSIGASMGEIIKVRRGEMSGRGEGEVGEHGGSLRGERESNCGEGEWRESEMEVEMDGRVWDNISRRRV